MDDPSLPPPPATAPPAEPPQPLPWEDTGVGLFEGFFGTAKLFILEPERAFGRIPTVGLGRPFFFALIVAWIEMLAGAAYFFLFNVPMFLAGLPELEDEIGEVMVGAGFMGLLMVGIFILMPVFLAIGLCIHSCILHLMLIILGEGKGGFEGTVRLLCYAHTADLAALIPMCGGILSLAWFIVLQVIGVARVHRCSYGKAAVAVLLPILLCCVCVAVLIAGAIGIGLAADS